MIFWGLTVSILILFAAAWRSWGDRASTAIVVIAALVSLAGFIRILDSGKGHLGDIRISLLGIEVPLEPQRPIYFGGDRASDSVVMAPRNAADTGLHPRAVRVATDAGGGVRIWYNRPDGVGVAGVVDWRPVGRGPFGFKPPWQRIDSAEFTEQSRLCIPLALSKTSRQARMGAVELRPDRRLELDGQVGLREVPARAGPDRIFPVRIYAAAQPADVGRGPLAASRTFLFRRGGRLYVSLLDQGATVVARGTACVAAKAQATKGPLLKTGEPIELSFRTLSSADDWLAEERLASGEDMPRVRAQERRSLTLDLPAPDPEAARRGKAARMAVKFNQPEALVLKADDILSALPTGSNARVRILLNDPSSLGSSPDVAALSLRSIGRPVLRDILQRIELDGGHRFFVAGDERQNMPLTFGDSIDLGIGATAKLQVERVDWRWGPFLGLWLLAPAALLASVAGTWRWRRQSAPAFIILSLGDFLLLTRLLIAVEGAAIDTRPQIAATVPAALLALAAMPFVFSALAPDRLRQARSVVLAQALFVALVAAHLLLFNGGVRLAAAAPLGLALLALAWALGGDQRRAAAVEAVRGTWRQAQNLVGGGLLSFYQYGRERLGSPARPYAPAGRSFAGLLLLLALMLVLRLLPERFAIGGNVAVVYTALMVFLWALALAQFVVRPTLLRVLVAGLLVAAPLALSLFQDKGYAIVYLLPMLLFALVLAAWREPAKGFWRTRIALMLPAILGAGLLVLAQVNSAAPAASEWPAPDEHSEQATAKRLELLEKAVKAERQDLRFQAFWKPQGLAEKGTLDAEGLRLAKQVWTEYASQGFLGRGYLNLPEPGELRRYHLSDNLAAVHLLAPFGRGGAAAFLLVLAAAAMGLAWRVRHAIGGDWPGATDLVGLLSLWTMFGASAYMVLANLNYIFFTGRNVLLLSAYSPSDLMEGAALLMLALVTLGWRR
ncbi:hypothetical protein [Caulobacter sp. NIBR1757]|uniref:hypothetical protein n=1 Tax=Caulobacter sp. NIBR1757 TaxID=3016000 RepID=UPI0022F1004A|nr:hypothetical protein [Caulobacter sp. NIBR1757]WGM37675.1 hypothetical protein AMEJIAPC_00574 [Caulobacter sp. NIBR1757]